MMARFHCYVDPHQLKKPSELDMQLVGEPEIQKLEKSGRKVAEF